jgi:hypothetical protein
MNEAATAFVFIFVMLLVYLLPAVVAYSRAHKQTAAITALNVLGGWTLLGWVVSFVWALMRTD